MFDPFPKMQLYLYEIVQPSTTNGKLVAHVLVISGFEEVSRLANERSQSLLQMFLL